MVNESRGSKAGILRITAHDYMELESQFLRGELTQALHQMDANKALGPDGINIGFIKEFWNIMHKDYEDLMSKFHATGDLPQGMNSSFVVLIPKSSNPRLVIDFCPISLINCSLKILMKMLANRLRDPIDRLISKEQSGYIKGRAISESILVTSEVAHSI